MDYNLVEIWLRKDPIRWVSGVLAGLLAGGIAMGFAMVLATTYGFEIWFPAKLMGAILLGPSATEIANGTGSITAGWVLFEVLSAFLGFIFAHFTGTNSLKALLAMGLVWAVFSWIFIWNLFMQSFLVIFAARIPSGIVFPICVVFGLGLSSVAFFDSLFRKK